MKALSHSNKFVDCDVSSQSFLSHSQMTHLPIWRPPHPSPFLRITLPVGGLEEDVLELLHALFQLTGGEGRVTPVVQFDQLGVFLECVLGSFLCYHCNHILQWLNNSWKKLIHWSGLLPNTFRIGVSVSKWIQGRHSMWSIYNIYKITLISTLSTKTYSMYEKASKQFPNSKNSLRPRFWNSRICHFVHTDAQLRWEILLRRNKQELQYSIICLIPHALGEKFYVRIDRVSDYTVKNA